MTAPQPPGTSAPRPTLSRELAEFLIELSIGLNKFAMYPGGHPSLQPAAEGLVRKLDRLLTDRGTLSVGVARSQLVIEGVATESKNPVLKDLAGRLHRHHLGAVTFNRGVQGAEIHEFLSRVAVEADRSQQPLGFAIGTREATWPNIRIYPLLYDRLQLVQEEDASPPEDSQARSQRTRAAQLWIGMARAALASGDAAAASPVSDGQETEGGEGSRPKPDDDNVPTDPTAVAEAIEQHPRGAAYDQVIVGYMLQIAEELRAAGGQESLDLRRRMSQLVSQLSEGTLTRLLDMGGDRMQRRRFLLDATKGMAVDAVIELVRAASEDEKQTVSHGMLRMLQKLARQAESGTGARRAAAEESVRDQISEMIRDWSLDDPNPEAYSQVLENLATSDPMFAVAPEVAHAPEPQRIIQMAIEVGVVGAPLTTAAAAVVDRGELRWLIETLSTAARNSATEALWTYLATPQHLTEILKREPIDTASLDFLLPRLGGAAAGPMLDALSEVKSAQSRRQLMDRLKQGGPDVGPAAVQRLADERWFVKRNMLRIIGDLGGAPPEFRALEYFHHEDARVRREALRLLLADPAQRERAIYVALSDGDANIVRTALASALKNCPPAAVPLVAARTLAGGAEDLRILAIRVLGSSAQRGGLDALLRLAAPRKTFLGFRKTPPKTPPYLAALAALHAFPDDARSKDILAHAARSKDPDIGRAATGHAPVPETPSDPPGE